jgi:hydrogenase expression/formation protein HypD
MRFVDEYRGEGEAQALLAAIRADVGPPVTIMEVCGGQTHSIIKYGIDELLPAEITLLHGPGCPVCVTPVSLIDHAVSLAQRSEVILASFGDMLRVPGTDADLLKTKALGGDVRIVYSPLDAVRLAQREPDRQVVFFAVGFETTAPAVAMAVQHAATLGLETFSILCAHVLVPPALKALLASPDNQVQAFLAPGHVCAVMGFWQYEPIASKYRVPIVVTGFEPFDLLQGISQAVKALHDERFEVKNEYGRAVTRRGNEAAQRAMATAFAVCDREWRGIGLIPDSGLRLHERFSAFDAVRRFDLKTAPAPVATECIAGEVLRGRKKPPACAAFGTRCTPEHPLGAPMVSAEGVCAAYYQFGRRS